MNQVGLFWRVYIADNVYILTCGCDGDSYPEGFVVYLLQMTPEAERQNGSVHCGTFNFSFMKELQ